MFEYGNTRSDGCAGDARANGGTHGRTTNGGTRDGVGRANGGATQRHGRPDRIRVGGCFGLGTRIGGGVAPDWRLRGHRHRG